MIRFFLSLSVFILAFSASAKTGPKQPEELGAVTWLRDYEKAQKASEETGKPVLILFQEVPGCSNCTTYGNSILSEPLLVEAIEDLFVPLAVFNNKGGKGFGEVS